MMKEWSFYVGDSGILDLAEMEENQRKMTFDSDAALEKIVHALKENYSKAAYDVFEDPAIIQLSP